FGAPAEAARLAAVVLDGADAQCRTDRVRLAYRARLESEQRLVHRRGPIGFVVEHLAHGSGEIVREGGMREPGVASRLRAVLRAHARDLRRQHDDRRTFAAVVGLLRFLDLAAALPSG